MKKYLERIILIVSLLCATTTSSAADGDKFKVITKTSEISDGDMVMVVRLQGKNESCNYVLSTTLNDNSHVIKAKPIDVDGDVATANADAEVFKIEKSGAYYRLLFVEKIKYLCNDNTKSSSGNSIAYRTTTDREFKTSANIQISFGPDNVVNLLYPKSGSYIERALSFSNVNGGTNFNCYNSSNWNSEYNCVCLFKKITDEVAFSDESDNSDIIVQSKGKAVNVALTRTLVANKWNTFCVPFNVSLVDGTLYGVKAFVMEYAETMGNVMMFTQSNAIEAGKAYLIKPEEDIVNPAFKGVTIVGDEPVVSGDESGYSYRGVYSPKTFDAEECKRSLIVNGNDYDPFLRPAANSKMRGMRAYFTTPTIGTLDMPQLKIGGTPTSISEIVSDVDIPCRANGIYTIDGMKVDNAKQLKRGVYVNNGRKYVVK